MNMVLDLSEIKLSIDSIGISGNGLSGNGMQGNGFEPISEVLLNDIEKELFSIR